MKKLDVKKLIADIKSGLRRGISVFEKMGLRRRMVIFGALGVAVAAVVLAVVITGSNEPQQVSAAIVPTATTAAITPSPSRCRQQRQRRLSTLHLRSATRARMCVSFRNG